MNKKIFGKNFEHILCSGKQKMNMKNLLSILVIGTFLLFAGCSKIGLGGADDASQSGIGIGGGSSSKGGSGVDLTFADGRPASEMYKGQPTTFAFVFTNYQEHEVSDLEVKTHGFDTGYVGNLDDRYNVQTIPRATEQVGPGIYAGLIVSGVTVDGFEGNYNFDPKFDYCYSAKTSYREQICVPSKINTCDLKIDKNTKQNGPISVKVDRISSVEDQVRVDFTISDSGNGQVVNECFKDDDYANEYKLKVSLGSVDGQCEALSGQNIIQGKSKFYCTFNRQGEEEYSSQIVVALDYKYQQSKELGIVVKDLNQGYE